jgi:hypothetical protein
LGSFAQTQSSSQQEFQKTGIIYFWSPGMPLSKKGVKEAEALTQKIRHIFKNQSQYEKYKKVAHEFWIKEIQTPSDSDRLPANK